MLFLLQNFTNNILSLFYILIFFENITIYYPVHATFIRHVLLEWHQYGMLHFVGVSFNECWCPILRSVDAWPNWHKYTKYVCNYHLIGWLVCSFWSQIFTNSKLAIFNFLDFFFWDFLKDILENSWLCFQDTTLVMLLGAQFRLCSYKQDLGHSHWVKSNLFSFGSFATPLDFFLDYFWEECFSQSHDWVGNFCLSSRKIRLVG